MCTQISLLSFYTHFHNLCRKLFSKFCKSFSHGGRHYFWKGAQDSQYLLNPLFCMKGEANASVCSSWKWHELKTAIEAIKFKYNNLIMQSKVHFLEEKSIVFSWLNFQVNRFKMWVYSFLCENVPSFYSFKTVLFCSQVQKWLFNCDKKA